jgi:hypothetical protein
VAPATPHATAALNVGRRTGSSTRRCARPCQGTTGRRSRRQLQHLVGLCHSLTRDGLRKGCHVGEFLCVCGRGGVLAVWFTPILCYAWLWCVRDGVQQYSTNGRLPVTAAAAPQHSQSTAQSVTHRVCNAPGALPCVCVPMHCCLSEAAMATQQSAPHVHIVHIVHIVHRGQQQQDTCGNFIRGKIAQPLLKHASFCAKSDQAV